LMQQVNEEPEPVLPVPFALVPLALVLPAPPSPDPPDPSPLLQALVATRPRVVNATINFEENMGPPRGEPRRLAAASRKMDPTFLPGMSDF
jgi:hypothetical protein